MRAGVLHDRFGFLTQVAGTAGVKQSRFGGSDELAEIQLAVGQKPPSQSHGAQGAIMKAVFGGGDIEDAVATAELMIAVGDGVKGFEGVESGCFLLMSIPPSSTNEHGDVVQLSHHHFADRVAVDFVQQAVNVMKELFRRSGLEASDQRVKPFRCQQLIDQLMVLDRVTRAAVFLYGVGRFGQQCGQVSREFLLPLGQQPGDVVKVFRKHEKHFAFDRFHGRAQFEKIGGNEKMNGLLAPKMGF